MQDNQRANTAMSESTDTVSLLKDAEIAPEQFLQVIRPYFARLQTPAAFNAYCRPSTLGPPSLWLASWKGAPAGVHGVFPFPFLVDGEPRVGGKPEFGSLHPDVITQRPRPDIFGTLMDEVIAEGRRRKWPFLVGWPSASSLKAHGRKGFKSLPMRHHLLLWPLRHRHTVELGRSAMGAEPGVFKSLACSAAGGFSWIVRAFLRMALPPSLPSPVSLIPVNDIASIADLTTPRYWNDRRITVWRDLGFLASRLRVDDGYRIISCDLGKNKPRAVAFVRLDGRGMWVLDVLPPVLTSSPALWIHLLRFAKDSGAGYMYVRLYHSNSFHRNAIHSLRRHLPCLARTRELPMMSMALEPKFSFVEDVASWAGTDMMGVGF